MKLGIYTDAAELQKTRPWTYTPAGHEYGENEEKVIFHLRPFTRTTQELVTKRAKAKNLVQMSAEDALKGVGVGDQKAEAYTRVLADFLIADWEGIVFASDFVDEESGNEYKKGDAIPCESRFKVFLFEDVDVAVQIVKAAQSFATLQISDESKNAGRSSGGTGARESSQSQTSA